MEIVYIRTDKGTCTLPEFWAEEADEAQPAGIDPVLLVLEKENFWQFVGLDSTLKSPSNTKNKENCTCLLDIHVSNYKV